MGISHLKRYTLYKPKVKNNMNWNLQSGVIIIGSLLWQDYLEKEGDNIRLNWRNSNLDINNRISIKVPIRYGRISKSGIPTMVYSNRMKNKLGFGYAIPLKKLINNLEELTCESVALSAAEGMKGNFVRSWGVLTYLLNDKKIEPNQRNEIIKFFIKRKNSKFEVNEYKVTPEKSCITESLKLNVNWVEPILESDAEKLNKFDFLMATATKPKNKLLTYKEIAHGIKSDNDRKYFINNLSNGIITNEDFNISKLL